MNPPKKRTLGPSRELLDRGLKVCSLIESDSDVPGAIVTEEGVLQWRFRTEPRRGAWSLRNLIRKPEFVVVDSGESELLRIRRERRFPPQLDIIRKYQRRYSIGNPDSSD